MLGTGTSRRAPLHVSTFTRGLPALCSVHEPSSSALHPPRPMCTNRVVQVWGLNFATTSFGRVLERHIRYVKLGKFVRIPEGGVADFIEPGEMPARW